MRAFTVRLIWSPEKSNEILMLLVYDIFTSGIYFVLIQDVVETLEEKRKAKAAVYYEHKKKLQVRTSQASQ